MRAIVLNRRIVKMLTFLVVIIPRLALSDANLAHSSKRADRSNRELAYELDPEDNENCVSLGALDIVFRTDNYGPPKVGIVLTDRGSIPGPPGGRSAILFVILISSGRLHQY